MYWPESGKLVFHVDAYNLGKSLIPFLKSEPASSRDDLVEMLKAYESYRSNTSRVMKPLYDNRYSYIKRLVSENDPYLGLFKDPAEVLQLVDRQKAAHRKAMTAEYGWQRAMMDAGIWDDGMERFQVSHYLAGCQDRQNDNHATGERDSSFHQTSISISISLPV